MTRLETELDEAQHADSLLRLDGEEAGELLLVRHAAPAARFEGEPPLDPMLSCEGLDQTERLAERLRWLWVEAVYTAPERRAFQTAKIVADLLQRPLKTSEGLADLGQEPTADARRRVLHCIDGLTRRHPGRRILAVSHSSVINAYLADVLDLAADRFFAPDHAAISTVRYQADRIALRSLNDTAHLGIADRIGGYAPALTARSLPLTNR